MSFNISSNLIFLKKLVIFDFFTIIRLYKCNYCIVPFIVPFDVSMLLIMKTKLQL